MEWQWQWMHMDATGVFVFCWVAAKAHLLIGQSWWYFHSARRMVRRVTPTNQQFLESSPAQQKKWLRCAAAFSFDAVVAYSTSCRAMALSSFSPIQSTSIHTNYQKFISMSQIHHLGKTSFSLSLSLDSLSISIYTWNYMNTCIYIICIYTYTYILAYIHMHIMILYVY